MNDPKGLLSSEQLSLVPNGTLNHNGAEPQEYPETHWHLVPFPAAKGVPFNADNLATVNDHSFLHDVTFVKARTAAESRWVEGSRDISWRLHVFLWAVRVAISRNPSANLVEFGTGKGYMAAACCTQLGDDTDFSGRLFLFDTFQQGDQDLFYYSSDAEEVRRYFDVYDFVQVIEGQLPESFQRSDIASVSFVHVDLNSAQAELLALREVSSVLDPNALILFDDAGNPGCRPQLEVATGFANSIGRPLLQLPTGQALIA